MEKLANGYEYEELVGDELAEQKNDFKGYDHSLIRVHPDGVILTSYFLKYYNDIYNMEVS